MDASDGARGALRVQPAWIGLPEILRKVLCYNRATELSVTVLCRQKRVSKAWMQAVMAALADLAWLASFVHAGALFVQDLTDNRMAWLAMECLTFQDRMQAFTLRADVQCKCIKFLEWLLDTKARSQHFKRLGVRLVLQALRAHPDEQRVQDFGLQALQNIAWHSYGQDALREGGAMAYLVALLDRPVSRSAVQALHYTMFRPFCACHENFHALIRARVPLLLIRAMEMNAPRTDVLEACMEFMECMSTFDAPLLALPLHAARRIMQENAP